MNWTNDLNAGNGLVVDASVAVKWHLRDEGLVQEAEALLDRYLARRLTLAAPSFIRYELANTLEQARRQERITADQATKELVTFLQLRVHAEQDTDALVELARDVAERIGASVYDATYIAFAEQTGLGFVTDDRQLLTRVANYPIEAFHLSEVLTLL